jgi:predicted acyltransferase
MIDAPTSPAAMQPQVQNPSATQRLLSLDALRGFDMFWIVGGEEIFQTLHKAWPSSATRLIDGQLHHKEWQGVAFEDLIFPLFVFIVGVSLVFSLTRAIERNGKAIALKRILFRSLVLYAFGLIVYGGLSKGLDHVRWMGVLQRIAICYFFAGLIFCNFRLRGMIAICTALLIGYWALMTFVPFPDVRPSPGGDAVITKDIGFTNVSQLGMASTNMLRGQFIQGVNLANYIDQKHLPGHKWDGTYDPEGILSTLPAIATCLLGVFAGLLLKNRSIPDQKKVLYLFCAGIAGVALGFIWGIQFPVIKKLWTSSYVLVAGGYSCLFLAVFYQLVEIWQWRKWCIPFVWIGMNPITIYLVYHLVPFEDLAKCLAGGPIQGAMGSAGELMIALVVVLLMFAFVRFLYTRKIFLRL